VSDFRLRDLVPKPIQGILGKLGLDGRYLTAHRLLVREPSDVLVEPRDRVSSPFEFLSASTAVYAFVAVVCFSIPEGLLAKSYDPEGVLKEYMVSWLTLYGFTLLVALIGIHADMLFFYFFRNKPSVPLRYKTRVLAVSYLWGWALFWTAPTLFLERLALRAPAWNQDLQAVEVFLRTAVALAQFGIAASLLDLNHERVLRYLRWVWVYLPLALLVAVCLAAF